MKTGSFAVAVPCPGRPCRRDGRSSDLHDADGVCAVAQWVTTLYQPDPPEAWSAAKRAGTSSGTFDVEGGVDLDYTDRLRCLAIGRAHVVKADVAEADVGSGELDPKTLALVRLAALVAVGGAGPSYGAQADAAVDAGASATEIVDVLIGVVPVVGLPRVVAAAPKLALALGYDTDDALEQPSEE
jgi:alkylhydroperoxidase/carboxymuconolactone decarboxylase family protein YurZ